MDSAETKVLLVITKSNWGGAQAYVYDLAVAFREKGMQVAVALGGDGLLAERLAETGIRIIPLTGLTRDVAMLETKESIFDPKAIYRSIKQELSVLKELVRICKEERPDVLHLNSSKIGGIGSVAGRIAGVRNIVFTAHGWPHKEPRPLPVRIMIWFLSWITVGLATTIIAVSENDITLAPVLLSRKKLRLVRNGVDTFPMLTREKARHTLSIPEDARIILSIAELHRNKGIDTAISAFAEIASAHPEWLYVVLGEGEMREDLESYITHYRLESRVLLLGFTPDARTYLHAADLFLLPSRKEGLPITLLEAGHAALPSVASRTGGIPEIVRNKETGLLAPPNNPHGLARVLRMMIEHPEEARQYGDALKKRVTEKFSREEMIIETLGAYKN